MASLLARNAIRGSLGIVALAMAAFSLAAHAQGKEAYKLGDRLKPDAKKAEQAYENTNWDQLLPPDWDPLKKLKTLDLGAMSDGDPRARKYLEELRAEWDRAPANPKLDKTRIRIPGFVVPLERSGDRVTEFLLVPYFGACIHTPPPPANQIIHAVAAKPLDGLRSMNAVWASGTLEIDRTETWMGNSSYRMKVDSVAPYTTGTGAK